MDNPIEMLKQDHQKVKGLFEEFENASDEESKTRIVDEALRELTVHATLEEELFYPAARKALGEDDLIDEAVEEHHVAKFLIQELASMKPRDERWEAKFCVLCESVKHHIEEEENEMLSKIERADLDLESLGARMLERKQQLTEEARSAKSPAAVLKKRSSRARVKRGKKQTAKARR
jgi:hemerythrin superfamily protein